MTKTKIQKVLAITILASLMIANIAHTSAVQIGTGSVTSQPAFDSVINWNGTYAGSSASGSVNGIIVTAEVLPVLNLEISTGAINLGTLIVGVTETGSLQLEVGTNAADGVLITARSGSGGLTKTSDNSIQINNLSTDGVQESYTFSSIDNAVADSTVTGFASTGDLSTTEVNDNTTEHTIYGTNKAEPNNLVDDVTFYVAATSSEQTPAGLYQDIVTFTVSGNF